MTIDMSSLIDAYKNYASMVNELVSSLKNASGGGIGVGTLMMLQFKMNTLTTFGTTATTVMQGLQDIAMSVARNTKGS